MSTTPTWKHFAAFIYDIFPILGIVIVTSLVTLIIRQGVTVKPYTPWFSLLILTEVILYYVYSWKIGGQTLGMRAWKMKIVPKNVKCAYLSWSQALLRFFIGVVSTLFIGFGVFWKLFSQSNQTWMDSISQSETMTYGNSDK